MADDCTLADLCLRVLGLRAHRWREHHRWTLHHSTRNAPSLEAIGNVETLSVTTDTLLRRMLAAAPAIGASTLAEVCVAAFGRFDALGGRPPRPVWVDGRPFDAERRPA